jgi:predicted transcriptional regulator of viral defense system
MKWEVFLKIAAKLPLVDTEALLAGVTDQVPLKVQISRWKKAGRLIQLRRGFYLLAEPFRKIEIHEPFIASMLKKPSYISLEKALEYHGLIPEAVPVYTSVTTKRQAKFVSPAGVFTYRHIKNSLFWGYRSYTLRKQTGFIASPEKALLDLVYFNGMDISLKYLHGLRLQNTEKIDPVALLDYANKFKSPGMDKAALVIKSYVDSGRGKEKEL